jgi:hypothetical protein
MGLMIPGELATLLNELGYTWPKSDETALFGLGQQWVGFADTARSIGASADAAVQTALTGNVGTDIEAFRAKWDAPLSARTVLTGAETGAQVIGMCLTVCAGVVLALKINVIIQLTTLAIEIFQAVATAGPTFGASLAEIPIFKKIADLLVNELIDEALAVVLG